MLTSSVSISFAGHYVKVGECGSVLYLNQRTPRDGRYYVAGTRQPLHPGGNMKSSISWSSRFLVRATHLLQSDLIEVSEEEKACATGKKNGEGLEQEEFEERTVSTLRLADGLFVDGRL